MAVTDWMFDFDISCHINSDILHLMFCEYILGATVTHLDFLILYIQRKQWLFFQSYIHSHFWSIYYNIGLCYSGLCSVRINYQCLLYYSDTDHPITFQQTNPCTFLLRTLLNFMILRNDSGLTFSCCNSCWTNIYVVDFVKNKLGETVWSVCLW